MFHPPVNNPGYTMTSYSFQPIPPTNNPGCGMTSYQPPAYNPGCVMTSYATNPPGCPMTSFHPLANNPGSASTPHSPGCGMTSYSPPVPGSVPSSPAPSTASRPASWDFSIQQLSRSLSQICNSPGSSCGDLSTVKDGRNGGGSNGHLQRSFSEQTASTSPPSPRVLDPPSKPVTMGTTGRMCRKIRIRHEESRKRLHEQLAFICQGRSGFGGLEKGLEKGLERRGVEKRGLERNGVERSGLDRGGLGRNGLEGNGVEKSEFERSGVERDGERNGVEKVKFELPVFERNEDEMLEEPIQPIQRPVIRRPSISSSLKINLDIGDVLVEQIAIRASSENIEICKLTENETVVLQSEAISEGYDMESLSCCLDAKFLSIRDYPGKTLKMQYPASRKYYFLPVLQQDDITGTWRLTLHVPGCYEARETPLQVKTVDEKLHVTWQENAGQCKVMIDLPNTAVTRSVSGVITEDNQLIVVGLLGARNRCLTL